MVCEGIKGVKGRLKMSKINALNSSVAFQGKSKVAKKKEAEPKEKKVSVGEKLTQPIKDEFEKAYGEGTKPNASLVADFIADNALKAGVAVAGAAAVFAKTRKSTNGLTKALKENFSKLTSKGAEAVQDGAEEIKKVGIFKGTIDAVKKAFAEVKANNLKSANEAAAQAAEAAKKGEGTSIFTSIKKSLLNPKDVDAESGLSKFIDKHLGKESRIGGFISKRIKVAEGAESVDVADLAKKGLAKVGVQSTGDLVDTAVAAGTTAVISSTANEITDDVTDNDNGQLAHKAKLEHFEQSLNTISKLADTAAAFGV